MNFRVPGDKSVSQRALILGALAQGENRIRRILTGADPIATAGALRALGAPIPPLDAAGGEIRFRGVGLRGFRPPEGTLDLANSGTGARLLLGVLAGSPLDAVVTGDESLRRRPMARVTDPLGTMGAEFTFLEAEDRLPLRVRGGSLSELTYRLPVASAQLKSALLLAGLVGRVPVHLVEPHRSRDHTERMLSASGCRVTSEPGEGGWQVDLPSPPESLEPQDLEVPGDFSSAAFFLLLGLLRQGAEPLVLEGVGLNETRTGLLPVLGRMGAELEIENRRGSDAGEPLGDLVVTPSHLVACEVGAEEVPGLIDEVPILAAGAARARGLTRITGAGELRVKETDRLKAMVENLRAVGVEAEELEDGMEIQGTDGPLEGAVKSYGDHRIAMAFGVLGALPGNRIRVEGRSVVGVSFPGFWELLARAGEHVRSAGQAPSETPETRGGEGFRKGVRRPSVITLDGPAGSGKSTTAREVARRLGFLHLDSGALYRALTYALLSVEIPEERWSELSPEELGRFDIRLDAEDGELRVLLDGRVLTRELRTKEVTEKVSPLSALPAVRHWLLDAQRRAASKGGLVADGRDMGTVVFPDANLKVFLTATLKERARRRFLEREARAPGPGEVEGEARSIERRDSRDSGRAVAPLRKPEGALEVDTSNLSFEAQVEVILRAAKNLD